jgi:hypothetical protein
VERLRRRIFAPWAKILRIVFRHGESRSENPIHPFALFHVYRGISEIAVDYSELALKFRHLLLGAS